MTTMRVMVVPLLMLMVACFLTFAGAFQSSLQRHHPCRAIHMLNGQSPAANGVVAATPRGRVGTTVTRREGVGGGAAAALLLLTLSLRPAPSSAAVKASSLEETRAAAEKVRQCIARVGDMQKAAAAGEWQKIGDVLSTDLFRTFEATATTLVRSDRLTAEDKVALGTIKRYGVIADAMIMLGGLEAELRAGGVEMSSPSSSSSSSAIIEDEEDEGSRGVNGPEVNRFLRLARGALEEIDRTVTTALEENS